MGYIIFTDAIWNLIWKTEYNSLKLTEPGGLVWIRQYSNISTIIRQHFLAKIVSPTLIYNLQTYKGHYIKLN